MESVQAELVNSIRLFLEDRDDANEEEGTTAEVSSLKRKWETLLGRSQTPPRDLGVPAAVASRDLTTSRSRSVV